MGGPSEPEYVRRCDHICLLDDGHVERGKPHFYGYEVPSPREMHESLWDLLERFGEIDIRVTQRDGTSHAYHIVEREKARPSEESRA